MRLATVNLLHGRSLADGRVDVERFRDGLRSLDADVLALQEVDRDQPRSHGFDLTACAAEAIGAEHHRFVPALLGTPGESWVDAADHADTGGPAYGVSLVSRYPLTGWQVSRLGRSRGGFPMVFPGRRWPIWVGDEPRLALAATLHGPLGPMTVVSTHLSFVPVWNGFQLRRLVREISTDGGQPVLMGDLNMSARAAARGSGLRPLVEERSYPADTPRHQLDHVLGGPALVQGASGTAVELPFSDHRAVVVDL